MKKWLKENIFVKDMFIYILISAIIVYIPAWGSVILGVTSGKSGFYVFAVTYVGFWAGPFTPTIPAIFGLAVAMKQGYKKITS